MAIKVECGGCGKTFSVKETMAGKRGKCPACGNAIVVPALTQAEPGPLSAPAPAPDSPPVIPPQPRAAAEPPAVRPAASLKSMQCESCGGAVEYQDGQGLFKCKYCGSVYESESADGGHAVVRTIRLVEKKLDNIESHTRKTADIASEERLQKKAALVQDKIDFKYIEFENSFGRKAGSAAIILWIIGAVLVIYGVGNSAVAAVVGLVAVAAGVGLFLLFKKAKAQFVTESEQMRRDELEPVYDQLRRAGATLEGGAISLGFTESTSVPMRYCVCCHKNITPQKIAGAGGGSLSGVNLLLTVMTCGLWIPAWILIAVMSKVGGAAGRAIRSGKCPECGAGTLFPARIPNA
ncbi:MAG: hypothetical protein V2A58_17610 [Planctomycetota bacterium]